MSVSPTIPPLRDAARASTLQVPWKRVRNESIVAAKEQRDVENNSEVRRQGRRNRTKMGLCSWLYIPLTLYHTYLCHSEPSDIHLDQPDPLSRDKMSAIVV